jgi:hypothetical protein
MNTWTWVLVAAVVLLLAGFLAFGVLRERRSRRLRENYGPEYERAVDEPGARRSAEAELDRRERRRAALDIHPLTSQARDRHGAEWHRTQTRFVDEPVDAVARADQEIMQVMRERGYPIEDFEQRAADVSVDHAEVVENYRVAHEISTRAVAGEASTEELRLAMVHYRALFEDLLGPDGQRESAARSGPPTPEETP